MGLTQLEAAEAMVCSQATVSRLESGREDTTLTTLDRRVFGMGLEVVISFRRRAVVR